MPNKKKKGRNKRTEDEGILLSEQQVKETLETFWNFSDFNRTMNQGVLNPFLINQRMKEISLNPIEAKQQDLDNALKDPKNSELALMGISEYFEIVSQPYKRLLTYLSNMLSWDLVYTPVNMDDESEYNTTKYKNEEKQLERKLDGFDYKKEFTIAVREMLRNEAFFCSPRYDGNSMVFQELPSTPNYTMITGRWAYGLLFSMNMYWFMLPGVDLDMYDPFFSKAFDELWKQGKIKQYQPSLDPTMRGQSSWVYWQDIPVDVGWGFKLSPEIATRVPYMTGLFSDLILQPLMRSLQKDVNLAVANRILAGEVPLLNTTSSKVADALAMKPETLAKFLQLVTSALASSVKATAAPLSNIKGVAFPSDNDLYPKFAQNMLALSGVNTNLIFTSQIRANQLESQLSLNVDEQLMLDVYYQFNQFMNYWFNKPEINGKNKKYLWKFEFEGTKFFTNKEERLNTQKELMTFGIVLPQKISAALGMRYADFKRQLREGRMTGFVDKLTPILQSSQLSGKGGRPSMSDSELGDAGAQSRESGTSNTTKGNE